MATSAGMIFGNIHKDTSGNWKINPYAINQGIHSVKVTNSSWSGNGKKVLTVTCEPCAAVHSIFTGTPAINNNALNLKVSSYLGAEPVTTFEIHFGDGKNFVGADEVPNFTYICVHAVAISKA